jgi:hypothetical protein
MEVEYAKTPSFFGRLPKEQEKQLLRGIVNDIEDVYVNVFIPFVVVDKEQVISGLKRMKKKIEELGI